MSRSMHAVCGESRWVDNNPHVPTSALRCISLRVLYAGKALRLELIFRILVYELDVVDSS